MQRTTLCSLLPGIAVPGLFLLALPLLTDRPAFAADAPLVARDVKPDTPLATFTITADDADRAARHRPRLRMVEVDPSLVHRDDLALIDEQGNQLAWQWVAGDPPKVAFIMNAMPDAPRTLHLVGRTRDFTTDLQLKQGREAIEITTATTGIRLLRGEPALEEGPIGGIRLPSGMWFAPGRMRVPLPAVEHRVRVIEKGPVFVDAEIVYQFLNDADWHIRIRVLRGSSAILVSERFRNTDDAQYRLILGAKFTPDHMMAAGDKSLEPIADKPIARPVEGEEGEPPTLATIHTDPAKGPHWLMLAQRNDAAKTEAQLAAAQAMAEATADDELMQDEDAQDQPAQPRNQADAKPDAPAAAVQAVLIAMMPLDAHTALRLPDSPASADVEHRSCVLTLSLHNGARRWALVTLDDKAVAAVEREPAAVDELAASLTWP